MRVRWYRENPDKPLPPELAYRKLIVLPDSTKYEDIVRGVDE